MSSERLPGKVMKPVLGEPMIGYTLKRLGKCKTIAQTVLATSESAEDAPLCDYAASLSVSSFKGSLDNVLERYVLANRQYGGDVVIRITGDCPLIDPEIVDLTVNAFMDADKDYIITGSGIRGLAAEVFSAEALERTYKTVEALTDFSNYKEHVTIYMYRHPDEFSVGGAIMRDELNRPYRLCVDEIDDFRLIEEIYNHFGHPYPTVWEIVGFLDANPEIAAINSHVEQKKA